MKKPFEFEYHQSAKALIGKKLVDMRQQTETEMELEGWDHPATVLVFEDGTKLYASRDEEGNGAGAMFGVTKQGLEIAIL